MKSLFSVEQLAASPSVWLGNSELAVKAYLPDSRHGFYRGCRFDWAGVIGSLIYCGHDFYVPWFQAVSPEVTDYVFDQGRVIASANTAASGPVEEFNDVGGALGYREAAAGGLFIKIGVGVLRRADSAAYSPFRAYQWIDAGQRTHAIAADRVAYIHTLDCRELGYSYRYVKTLRVLENTPTLLIEHELHNTGRRAIATSVYDHNFLNINGRGTVAGLALTTPFCLLAETPLNATVAEISGRRLQYHAAPTDEECLTTPLTGFGSGAADYRFHIATPAGAAVTLSADQPLARLLLWSIRPVMSIEPFIHMRIELGEIFRWTYRYEFAIAARAQGDASVYRGIAGPAG